MQHFSLKNSQLQEMQHLLEVCTKIIIGIVTGDNKTFIIDNDTKQKTN